MIRPAMPLFALLFTMIAVPALAEKPKEDKPITPTDGVIKLFNGKNLSGLYTWLEDTKYQDPRKVFTVKDGMLHITGDGLGYINTKKAYRDYHLIVEFKWGKRTWHGRKTKSMDSGILVHSIGADGGYHGRWMPSIESNIIQGGTGDFILVRGNYDDGTKVPLTLTAEIKHDRDGERVWKKGGKRETITGGRINWFGRDPDWKDELDFRGKQDVESPRNEWTRSEVICQGDTITNIVNGVVVNQGTAVFPTAGRIQLQAELAEIYFRRFELWPIGKAPKD